MDRASLVLEKIIFYSSIALLFGMLSPFDTGGGYFFESRAVFYLVAIALGAVFLVACLWDRFELQKTGFGFLFLLFYAVAVLSIYQQNNLRASLDSLVLFLSYFIVFFLAVNLVKNEARLKASLVVLVISGTLLSLQGIYQYLIGFKELQEYLGAQPVDAGLLNRVFAIFTSPNVLASLLAMIIPLAFVLLLMTAYPVLRILAALAVVLMAEACLLTASRGGLLALFLAMLILALGFWKRKEPGLFFLNLAYFSVIVGLAHFMLLRLAKWLEAGIVSHQPLEVSGAVASLGGRLDLWRGTLELFKSFPLLGSGIGTFAGVYPRFQWGAIYSKFTHNTYLQLFAETGVLGGLVFIVLIFCLWRKPLGRFFSSPGMSKQLFLLGISSGLTAFVFHNLIDFSLLIPAAGMAFWFLAGLAFSPSLTGPSEVAFLKTWTGRNRLLAAAAVSGLALGLVILVSMAFAGYLYREQAKEAAVEKDYLRAEKLLKKAVVFDPISSLNRQWLADNHHAIWHSGGGSDRSRLKKAIDSQKKAIALEPNWPEYRLRLAYLYFLSGNQKLALKEFKAAEGLYPNSLAYKVALGAFYYNNRQSEPALKKFSEVIDTPFYQTLITSGKIESDGTALNDPLLEIAKAFLYRGRIYLEVKKDYRKALEDFKQVVRIGPGFPDGHFYLGLAYKGLGETKQAVKALNQALKLDPRYKEAVEKELKKYEQGGCE